MNLRKPAARRLSTINEQPPTLDLLGRTRQLQGDQRGLKDGAEDRALPLSFAARHEPVCERRDGRPVFMRVKLGANPPRRDDQLVGRKLSHPGGGWALHRRDVGQQGLKIFRFH
jgi:hypothetical protein